MKKEKLTLTLAREDGLVIDKWTTDDPDDREAFLRLANSEVGTISEVTVDRIKEALSSVYWIKETRTYLIEASSEEHAEDIFNSSDFDEDWTNHEIEVGFEL